MGDTKRPEGLDKSQEAYRIKDPKRFCGDRKELQRCMLNAEVDWNVPQAMINASINKIRGLGITGLNEAKDIVVFLRKAIPVKLDPSLFWLYSYALLAPLTIRIGYGESPDKIADNFAKTVVLKYQSKYAGKPNSSIFDEIVYGLSRVKVDNRAADLSRQNIEAARTHLHKGDVVLVGEHKTLSSGAIGGALTHSMLYIGDGLFLHAKAEGVVTDSLEYIFRKYDTMAIVRPKEELDPAAIDKIVSAAKSHHGKPYDLDMKTGLDKLYCTELVQSSYASAGVTIKNPNDKGDVHKSPFAMKASSQSMHPMSLINGFTRIVWKSDNLTDPDDKGRMAFVLGGVNGQKPPISISKR